MLSLDEMRKTRDEFALTREDSAHPEERQLWGVVTEVWTAVIALAERQEVILAALGVDNEPSPGDAPQPESLKVGQAYRHTSGEKYDIAQGPHGYFLRNRTTGSSWSTASIAIGDIFGRTADQFTYLGEAP